MTSLVLWLTVLTFSSVFALQCDVADDTCSADSSTVSLRQLHLLHMHRAEQTDAARMRQGAKVDLPATCAEGKLLPEVYLLGAPKCATEALTRDMMNSGVQNVATLAKTAPELQTQPWETEFHYFLRWWYMNNNTWDREEVRRSWFDSLPSCGALGDVGARTIVGDFSTSHLALVPPGGGWTLDVTPQELRIGEDINLPVTLQAIYSYYMGLDTSRVRFIVNFREPLSRMQAHWHHLNYMKEVQNLPIPETLASNFSEDVRQSLDEFEQGKITNLLWLSLYNRQVQQYMSQFSAKQFIFIPYLYYIELAKADVCDALSQFLSYPVTCTEMVANLTHHNRPPLEEDVPADLLDRFQRTIAYENDYLVRLLLTGYQEGATLAHFQGSPHVDEDNIEAWLARGW